MIIIIDIGNCEDWYNLGIGINFSIYFFLGCCFFFFFIWILFCNFFILFLLNDLEKVCWLVWSVILWLFCIWGNWVLFINILCDKKENFFRKKNLLKRIWFFYVELLLFFVIFCFILRYLKIFVLINENILKFIKVFVLLVIWLFYFYFEINFFVIWYNY